MGSRVSPGSTRATCCTRPLAAAPLLYRAAFARFCRRLPLRPLARRELPVLRDGVRAVGPGRKLVGIVVESLGQAPIRQRSAADAAFAFGAGIDERPAALALEIRNAGFVHFEENRAVENKRKHKS